MVDLKEGGSLEAIVDTVTAAFESYDPAMLDNVWRGLFSVLTSVLEHQEAKTFGVSHKGGSNAVRTETMV